MFQNLSVATLLPPILGGISFGLYESFVKSAKRIKHKKEGRSMNYVLIASLELAISLYIGNMLSIWLASASLVGVPLELISKVVGGSVFAGVRKITHPKEKFLSKATEGAVFGLVGDAIAYPFGGNWKPSTPVSNVQQQTGAPYDPNNPLTNH